VKALLLGCVVVLAVVAGCGGAKRHAAAPSKTTTPQSRSYLASVRYARCMRDHGVAHPDPDQNGDFHLTPAQERRMRASASREQIQAADKDCFRYLKGVVSTKPLSKAAIKAALVPLRELKKCLAGYGYEVGKPMVRNMSRGRAMFGFDRATPPPATARGRKKLQAAQHTCEARVHLAARIDAIVKIDRGEAG
jgi:hypothetical protein